MSGIASGPLSLRLFGRPQILLANNVGPLGLRARGIISYLALSKAGRASRERLMGLFWPDRDEPQARASLRQCLVELRGCVGLALVADREWVTFDLARVTGDWRTLEKALASEGTNGLRAALAAIGDDRLIDELEFGESFDSWLRGCRADLDSRLATAVVDRVEAARHTGDVRGALMLADVWLRREPRDEAVAAAAIAAEMQRQAPAAARKRFREFEAMLKRDGDGPPGLALREALAALPIDPSVQVASNAVTLATKKEMELPSKPSIALLPFADVSGAGTNDDFADGMVEEISTVLARFSNLFVIAGQSSLSYRASGKSAQQIARELGVRYLLEGSVRRAGARVRITVKLIDAGYGQQIWAERFDGTFADIFELQDHVAVAVARTIDSTVTDAEMHRAVVRPIATPDSYELTLRANVRLNRYTKASIREALELADAAVALDPGHGWAIAIAGFAHAALWMNSWSETPRASRAAARDLISRAIRIAPNDELTLAVAAGALLNINDDLALASQLIERAVTLNPAKAYTLFWAAWLNLLQGNPNLALERFETTIRANPRSAYRPFQLIGLGNCLFFVHRWDEAAIVLAEVIQIVPDYAPAHTVLVASLVRSNKMREAAAAADRAGGHGRLRDGLPYFVDLAQRAAIEAALAELTITDCDRDDGGPEMTKAAET